MGVGAESVVAASKVLDERVAGDDHRRGPVARNHHSLSADEQDASEAEVSARFDDDAEQVVRRAKRRRRGTGE